MNNGLYIYKNIYSILWIFDASSSPVVSPWATHDRAVTLTSNLISLKVFKDNQICLKVFNKNSC